MFEIQINVNDSFSENADRLSVSIVLYKALGKSETVKNTGCVFEKSCVPVYFIRDRRR